MSPLFPPPCSPGVTSSLSVLQRPLLPRSVLSESPRSSTFYHSPLLPRLFPSPSPVLPETAPSSQCSPGAPSSLAVLSEYPPPSPYSHRVFFFISGNFCLLFFQYFIQHCFICRPSDSTVEPRTVATSVLTARCSNHSDRSHSTADISHVFEGKRYMYTACTVIVR
jgi:hypothetical protein